MTNYSDFIYIPVHFSQDLAINAEEWPIYYISFPYVENQMPSSSNSNNQNVQSPNQNNNGNPVINPNDYIYFSTDINQQFFSVVFLPMFEMEFLDNETDKYNCIKFKYKINQNISFYIYSYDSLSLFTLIQYISKSIKQEIQYSKFLTSSIQVKPTIIAAMKQKWTLLNNGNIQLYKKSGIQEYPISCISQLDPLFDPKKPNCFQYLSKGMDAPYIEKYFDIEEWKLFIKYFYNNINYMSTKIKIDS